MEYVAAQVQLSWGSLYLAVLQAAETATNADEEDNNGYDDSTCLISTQFDVFTTLKLEPIASDLTVTLPYAFESARDIFKSAHFHFEAAKKVLKLDGFVTEYVSILQNISLCYKGLCRFEENDKRKLAMQQRRYISLNTIVSELNRDIYTGLSKELYFEIGEICNEMASIRERMIVQKGDNAKITDYVKYNTISQTSIDAYESFVKSYQNNENNEWNKDLPTDEVRPILRSLFHAARLYSRLQSTDTVLTRSWLTKSVDTFQKMGELHAQHPAEEVQYDAEIGLGKEMESLLMEKLQRLDIAASSQTSMESFSNNNGGRAE